MILAGNGPQWHTPMTAARPVQWLGDVSYSLYLWHWPLIVLAPFAVGAVLTTPHKIAVLGAAILLAFATKVLVEDPGRTFIRSTRLTFAAMVVGLVVIATGAYGLTTTYDQRVDEAAREMTTDTGRCHGAAALADDCPGPFGPARVTAMGPANEYFRLPRDCVQLDDYRMGEEKTTWVCDFSKGAPDPEVVWLIGDSHAVHWQGPVVDLARERGWLLKFATVGGCPFAKVEFTGYRTPASDDFKRDCMDWTERMAGVVAADRPSTVFM